MSGRRLVLYYLRRFSQIWRAFGARAAAHVLCDRLLARAIHLDVETILWLDADAIRIGPEQAPAFTFRFLSAEEVAAFAQEPDYHLTPDFADRIRRGRDFCHAAFAPDGRLATYSWYALRRIEPEHCAGVGLELPDGVGYAYKSFTHPDFRGARLHGAAMARAVRAFRGRGVTALIALVHWTNHSSLRAFLRLGYVGIGRLWSYRVGGSRRAHVPVPEQVHGVRFGAHRRTRPAGPISTWGLFGGRRPLKGQAPRARPPESGSSPARMTEGPPAPPASATGLEW